MYTNKQIWNVSYPIFLSLLAQNIINAVSYTHLILQHVRIFLL